MAHDITKDVIGCKEFEVQDINQSGESANFFGAITDPNHIINKAYSDAQDAGIISDFLDDHPHQDVNTTASPTFVKVTIGDTTSAVPLTIKAVGDKGIRIYETSGNEFYDIAVDVGGDLNFINDAGVITMKIRDFDGRVGIGTGAAVPNALLELGGTSSIMTFVIRPNGDTWLGLQASDDDGLLWANNGKAGASNGNTIFTDFVNRNKDHGHNTLSPDPTIFIHSLTNVDTDNTQWMSFTHNRTDAEINTGTGGVEINGKSKMTRLGGFATKITNKTGANTIQGQLVAIYTATDINDAFKVAALNDQEVIGVVLDAGVSDGSEAWIVWGGVADVLMDDGGAERGDRIISSGNTAGSGDVWNVGGAVATHFQEIGHCKESIGAAPILARCMIHFN